MAVKQHQKSEDFLCMCALLEVKFQFKRNFFLFQVECTYYTFIEKTLAHSDRIDRV